VTRLAKLPPRYPISLTGVEAFYSPEQEKIRERVWVFVDVIRCSLAVWELSCVLSRVQARRLSPNEPL
jgi:hypothetical protein